MVRKILIAAVLLFVGTVSAQTSTPTIEWSGNYDVLQVDGHRYILADDAMIEDVFGYYVAVAVVVDLIEVYEYRGFWIGYGNIAPTLHRPNGGIYVFSVAPAEYGASQDSLRYRISDLESVKADMHRRVDEFITAIDG